MTLQQWMDWKGLKDADFAAEIKVLSRSQVSRIRRGKSIPSIETAKALETKTGIPASKFVMGEAA